MAKDKPTRSAVAAWEEEGKSLYRRGYPEPKGGAGAWARCRRRGWLLAAAEQLPGGWAESIPAAPPTCD